jgi:CubicO group peptidase (beta-lactamase class C family)
VSGIDPATARALSHRLAVEQSDCRLPSVAAGLVRAGELVWSDAVGTVDGRSDGVASTVQTQYRLGSITKTFVAVEVLRMRDAGLLDLNDSLARHIDGTLFGSQVTIAQLLSHTSGLQAETNGPWWERTAGGTWADLMAGKPTLKFRPGAKFHYSNVGYAVLGELIGRLRGQPWGDVVRADLLEPLGMRHTSARPQDEAAAHGLGVHPLADLLHVEPEHDAAAMAPAGQLWSTVQDLSRWAAFLAGETGGLLSSDTLDEMRSPVALDDKSGAAWTGAYGLGCQLWNIDGIRYSGHGGSMPGFLAGVRVNIETGDGCVVLANTTAGLGTVSTDLMAILADREPIAPEPWSADSDQTSVLELTGEWYWGTAAFTMSATRDGYLVLGEPGEGRGCRFKRAAGAWAGLDGYYSGEKLTVVRDGSDRVSHLDLGSFRLTRTPYDPSADVPGGVDPAGWH